MAWTGAQSFLKITGRGVLSSVVWQPPRGDDLLHAIYHVSCQAYPKHQSLDVLTAFNRCAGSLLRASLPRKLFEQLVDGPYHATPADRRPSLASFLGLTMKITQQDSGRLVDIEHDTL